MADGRARIVAELAGQSQVVSGLKSIGDSLSGLASKGLAAAGVLGGFNLGNAIAQAENLSLQTERIGMAAGRMGSDLKSNFEGLEKRLLVPADRIAAVSTAIGRMTGDMGYGIDAIGSLGDEALATGRQLEDMVDIGVTLGEMGVRAADVGDELERLRSLADRLKTVGGPVALYNTLAAMGPQLENVSFKTDQARDRWTAFIARATKGMRPEQAKQTASRLMQEAQTRALDVEHATGKRQRDDQGRLLDPFAVLETVSKMTKRYQGPRQARWAFEDALGPEAGAALNNLDTSKVDADVAAGNAAVQAKEGRAAIAQIFRDSAPGKRLQSKLADQAAQRDLGELGAPMKDKINESLGAKGKLATAVTSEALHGLISVLPGDLEKNKLVKPAVDLASVAVGWGWGKAFDPNDPGWADRAAADKAAKASEAAAADASVSTRGDDWRKKQAESVGAEIAAQARRTGDLRGVIGKAQGDPAAITAALVALEKQFDQLPDRLAQQVAAGLDQSLHRNPLYARVERNPRDQQVN